MEIKSAEERKEEIINACEELYKSKSFNEITIKDIGEKTSFSRPSIYNYFGTKEEIFLAIVEREYIKWNKDLSKILEQNDELTKQKFIDEITGSLNKRKTLLKLISMNMFEIEKNSSSDCITNYKKIFKESITLLEKCFGKFLSVNDLEAEELTFTFLPFLVGVYPYTSVTEKQTKALKRIDFNYKFYSIPELIKIGLEKIVGGVNLK